eukprot:983690_1
MIVWPSQHVVVEVIMMMGRSRCILYQTITGWLQKSCLRAASESCQELNHFTQITMLCDSTAFLSKTISMAIYNMRRMDRYNMALCPSIPQYSIGDFTHTCISGPQTHYADSLTLTIVLRAFEQLTRVYTRMRINRLARALLCGVDFELEELVIRETLAAGGEENVHIGHVVCPHFESEQHYCHHVEETRQENNMMYRYVRNDKCSGGVASSTHSSLPGSKQWVGSQDSFDVSTMCLAPNSLCPTKRSRSRPGVNGARSGGLHVDFATKTIEFPPVTRS